MPDPQSSTSSRAGRKAHGLILFPGTLVAAVADAGNRRLLARGDASRDPAPATDLEAVMRALGEPSPTTALAALRLWGQTGQRPGDWVAGADPVCLEAGLDKLYLHAPPAGDVEPDELHALFADIDGRVLARGEGRLQAVDACGYLHGRPDIATAGLPAELLDGERPDAYMPSGPAARSYLSLDSELQMSLHQHPLNLRREAAGRRPLNALWLWGGGEAPAPAGRELPALFAERPLLRGYWQACRQPVADWPGSLAACADLAAGDFVAALPGAGLDEFAALWRSGGLQRATLLFADGASVRLRRGLRALFRRRSPLITSLGAGAS